MRRNPQSSKRRKELLEKYDFLKPTEDNLMEYGLCCDDGWLRLLEMTFKSINFIVLRDNLDFEVIQVKQKLGGLRIYVGNANDDIRKIIEIAEIEAERTCEVCGKPGTTHYFSWLIKTVCDECAEIYERKVDDENE